MSCLFFSCSYSCFCAFCDFASVLFCDSGPSLESSGSYEAVHLTFMFTRHGMILTCHVSTPTSSWPVSFDATKCLLASSHPVISFFSACIPPVHGLAQASQENRTRPGFPSGTTPSGNLISAFFAFCFFFPPAYPLAVLFFPHLVCLGLLWRRRPVSGNELDISPSASTPVLCLKPRVT